MRKITFLLLGAILLGNHLQAQNTDSDRVITTAVPFLLVAADARAAGMADQGVATSPDVFSQQWNPAKYAFYTRENGVGVAYTPYLSKIVNDIFLGGASYVQKLNEKSAFAGSLRYFSLGAIETRDTFEQIYPIYVNPNSFTLDLSYALKLSEDFSMAVAGRYLRSDLDTGGNENVAGSTFGVDVAAFYQSKEIAMSGFDGRWRLGANISNVGPKIKYDAAGQENFIPTNLRVGGGFDFIFDADNKLGTYVEFNKLLVPTPNQDFNGDGVIDNEDNEEYNSIGSIEGIFKSFGDAPNGFSEELKEVTWALGAEYLYQEKFALRAGYFNESPEKGFRRFFSLGAGFAYESVVIDMSYLFSTSSIPSPLEGTLRFGLSFNFGDTYSN